MQPTCKFKLLLFDNEASNLIWCVKAVKGSAMASQTNKIKTNIRGRPHPRVIMVHGYIDTWLTLFQQNNNGNQLVAKDIDCFEDITH